MAQISDKQIAYIERLAPRSRWYDEVARDMGCSPSAAQRRASSTDGSATIDRLLKSAGKSAPAKAPRAVRTPYGDYM